MNSDPVTINLADEGNTLSVKWKDGHRSTFLYAYLRDQCPCATCTEKSGTSQGLGAPTSDPPLPTSLPILGPSGPLKPKRAELVGHYALQIFWSDDHSTGIYTFDYLREICPCSKCASNGKSS